MVLLKVKGKYLMPEERTESTASAPNNQIYAGSRVAVLRLLLFNAEGQFSRTIPLPQSSLIPLTQRREFLLLLSIF